MDGTANSIVNGGSGIIAAGRFARHKSAAAVTGGTSTHNHADHTVPAHSHTIHTHNHLLAITKTSVDKNWDATTTLVVSDVLIAEKLTTMTEHPAVTLSHAAATHLPPWFEVCFIERLNNAC